MLRTSIQACGTATTTLAKPKPSPSIMHHALVHVGDRLAQQILAGDAEMDRALRQRAGDLGGRQIGDLDAGQAGDRAAIVARAARLDQLQAGAARRTPRCFPAAGPWPARR